MKYYYGNNYKEAISNSPIEINSAKVLNDYKDNYNVVIPADEVEDAEDADLYLEEDDYEHSEDCGTLKVSKDIYDDFNEGSITRIKFLDEEDEPIMEYQMVKEDDEWIYFDYFGFGD